MGDDQRGLRRARPVAAQLPPAGSRWAVVIGVSEYQDPRLNLRYAAQDAEDLAALIRTPNGGAFPDENVLLLTDRHATSREVTRALRSFLTRPAPEDLVLIYLACHGGPDPRRPTGPLYLLTHDTEYADIAGTAVPMDEIDGALRGSLLSERVVVIADTCHSGDLGGAGRRSVASAEVTNRYLNQLAGSKPGVALLTSCESAESSQEDGRWGGGHGVFTWHLLEGMRGAADGFGGRERDGIVSVGELFEYVRERVRADTEGQQHPSVGAAPFDRNLPMAVTGDLDTQRHLSLARHLIDLGWLTDDPAAFACAARETAVADGLAALTGTPLPAGKGLLAEALLATGRAAEAVVALGSQAAPGESPASDLIRGVALAQSGAPDAAAAALRRYAAGSPGNEEARWAGDYAAALEKGSTGTSHALLIGAGTVASLPDSSHLRGPSNDVAALADHLVNRLGFPASNVVTLTDRYAARPEIVAGLNQLAERTAPGDTVVVSFSGHATSARTDPGDAYFITYDTHAVEGTWRDGLSGDELAELIARIAGATRLLILDCQVTPAFEQRMSGQADWVTLTSTANVSDVSFGDVVYGALTRSLLDNWPLHPGVTVRDFTKRARQWLRERDFDTALVALGADAALTPAPPVGGPRLWWLARDRSTSEAKAHELEAAGPAVTAYGHGKWARGRQDLRAGAPGEALRSIDAARRELGSSIAALEIDRARALLALGRIADTAASLSENPALPSKWPEGFTQAAAAVAELAASRARALVVGIDEYGDAAVPAPSGARADADSFAATLERCGVVAADDIVLLLDADATRERILAEFDALAEHGADQLAVFHFAGVGSWAASGPTLLTADAGTAPGSSPSAGIALAELATRAASSPNLVAFIDAGSPGAPPPARDADGRFTPPVPGSRTANPSADYYPDSLLTSAGDDPVVGAVTVFAKAPRRSKDSSLELPATPHAPPRGRLTTGLEKALEQQHDVRRPREPVTYHAIIQRTGLRGRASVAGPAAAEPSFRHRTATASADSALRELELRPARATLTIATELLTEAEARSESEPRAYLEAGLAHAALGDHASALPLLRAARNLSEVGSGSTGRARTTDPMADEWRAWACYHLGRILYQQGGDLNEAVAALRAAHQASPDEARTSFHLAQAIKALIDRESLREVGDHLRRYLELGAPLGEVDQVRKILGSIR